MINPIYNITFFLIGMYFGILNFSIQRGIVLYKIDRGKSFTFLLSWKINKKKEIRFNQNNDDEKVNLFESSKEKNSNQKSEDSASNKSTEEKKIEDNYKFRNNEESLDKSASS